VHGAVAVVIDADDDAAFMRAAFDAHDPGAGRITVHPTPGASHPPGLAQDVLVALGKRLPQQAVGVPRHEASWADTIRPAWMAAACWINAYRIGHLIVARAHTLTTAQRSQLAAVQQQTGVLLSLLWHRPPDRDLHRLLDQLGRPAHVIDTHDRALLRLHHRGTRPHHHITPNWQPQRIRGGPDRGALPARLHVLAAHPLHAGLLATTLTTSATAYQLTTVRLSDLAPTAAAIALTTTDRGPVRRTWHPLPDWAQPLLTATRAWHYLNGHRHDSWPLLQHTNFHHHNQLIDTAHALGIAAPIKHLNANPAWPSPQREPTTSAREKRERDLQG
jgi:hypothetical protein